MAVAWTSHATPAGLTLAPEADAYVTKVHPDANFGGNIRFRVDGVQDTRTYLRFRVPDLGGKAVTRATLRVYATSAARVGYQARAIDDHSWEEETISYATAPHLSGTVLRNSGPFAAGTWTSVDVTPLVPGPGVVDLALTENHVTAIAFASRESAGTSPELVLTTALRTSLPLSPSRS
jgi:hypothetical protein